MLELSFGLPNGQIDPLSHARVPLRAGRIIADFVATSTDCSYYPFTRTTLATLARDIEGYRENKSESALHFDKPLPAALVRKWLEACIAELGRSK